MDIQPPKNWEWFYHQELNILFTKSDTGNIWERYNQLHKQVGVCQNTTVLTYDLLDLPRHTEEIRETGVKHHNHNQLKIT